MIYLLHFSEKYWHSRHYLGFVDGGEEELQKRIERHRNGDGARLIEVITEAGIGFTVVRTWPGGRSEERALKQRRNAALLCPECREAALERRRAYNRAYRERASTGVAVTATAAEVDDYEDLPF